MFNVSLRIVMGALALVTLLSPKASAIENYTGAVVGDCVTQNNIAYNVKATIGAGSPNWYVTSLQYVFTPTPAQLTSFDAPGGKTRYFLVTPGTYTVVVGNPNDQGKYTVTAPQCQASTKKGMTWRSVATHPTTGTISVGCANNCDAYKGDTPCTTPLPMMCIRKSGPGFPLPLPTGVNNSNQYYKWAGGVVATTAPVVPPPTLVAANAACAAQFGTDWRVAEFHDGWGWAFQAYGGVGDPSKRFWVHINNQPGATCWN